MNKRVRKAFPQVGIELIREGAEYPKIKTKGSAGADLVCPEDVEIPPFHMVGHGTLVPLGFRLDIPEGYCVHIYPRSSTGLKTPFIIPNSPGLIDTDYKEEVCLILTNLSRTTLRVDKGTALAQMVLVPKVPYELIVPRYGERVNPLDEAGERTGGFGSTTTITNSRKEKGEVKDDEN